ncbi:hypothetical protein Ancab_024330 [Ancistrocladus abbreviatus]
MDFSADKRLLPGFRFHPTDVELIMFYLKRKVLGKKLSPEVIAAVDIYKFAPWDLPDKSCLRSKDLNWYFFCPRGKKYSSGGRANRATELGYWKATGNDRTVSYNEQPVGKIKTLVFHRGKPPKGDRTDWLMHEYRLDDKNLADNGVAQDSYVLCKVFQKSGIGPKNGEQYGAPFVDEEWEDDEEIKGTNCIAAMPTCKQSTSSALATYVGTIVDDVNQVNDAPTLDDGDDDDLERLLSMFVDDNVDAGDNGGTERCDVFNGLEDLNDWKEISDGGFQSPRNHTWGEYFLELQDLEEPLFSDFNGKV